MLKDILIVLFGFAVVMGALGYGGVELFMRSEQARCAEVGREVSKETKYLPQSGCYVKLRSDSTACVLRATHVPVNDEWVPLRNWRPE